MTTPDPGLTSALEEKRAIINAAYESSGKGRDHTANEIYARVIALSALAAVQEVLKAAETWRALAGDSQAPFDLAIASCSQQVRDRIASALTGKETGDGA